MNITDEFLQQAEETAKKNALFKRNEKILIALSGGADSVALTRLLHLISEHHGISLVCAHLNHGFRGHESQRDLDFSSRLAEELGIPFFSSTINVPEIEQQRYGSSQMVARDVRYAFLERIARREGCDKIALAHNSNDRIETFLMKLMAGSSPAGLAAMPYKRDVYIRPIMDLSRKKIIAFLTALHQTYVEDSSNSGIKYRRNLIRHKLLPFLHDISPSFDAHVIHLMSMLDMENHYWESFFLEHGQLEMKHFGSGVVFPIEVLRNSPMPLVQRVLSRLAATIACSGRGPGYDFFTKLPSFLEEGHGSRVWFENAFITISEDQGMLYILPYNELAESEDFFIEVDQGDVSLPWGDVIVEELKPHGMDKKFFQEELKKGIFWMRSTGLTYPLIFRSRRPGDRIQLSGGGTKKIKDILIDGKVPSRLRRDCTVICDQSRVLAYLIPGQPEKSRLTHDMYAVQQEKMISIRISKYMRNRIEAGIDE